jgi:glycosyltransferase involved in cell wall biosynthesis
LGGYSLKDGRRGKLRDLGILNSNINLVYVGVLRRGKGLERLLRVFEKLYQSRPGVNLLIVGEGELGQELRRQCRDYLSRKNIYFLGFRRDVREILLVSDIFVLATEAEGMSNAILEAMASGLPMVTTNIEENREILNDEKEALLVEMTNERQLFLALTRLAEDRGLRLSLANNARNKVKDYNLELISRRLGEFFRSVVSGQ